MKFKALLLALFAAGLAVSLAVAAPPPGKGKDKDRDRGPKPVSTQAGTAGQTGTSGLTGTTGTTTSSEREHGKPAKTGPGCKPEVSFILKGSLASVAADSFAMSVTQANKHGSPLVGKQVTVMVDDRTKIKRRGHAKLSDLKPGDLLNVQVRACKAGDAAALKLVAKRVVARPAGSGGEDGQTGTTQTGTTSTGTTSTGTTSTGTTSTGTTQTGTTSTGTTTTTGS